MYTTILELEKIHEYFKKMGAGDMREQQAQGSGIWKMFNWGDNLITVSKISEDTVQIACGYGDNEAVDKELNLIRGMIDLEKQKDALQEIADFGQLQESLEKKDESER